MIDKVGIPLNKDSVYSLVNKSLKGCKNGEERELGVVVKKVDNQFMIYEIENLRGIKGLKKMIVYVNTESQDFLDNKVEFIENLLLQYQEDTGIEVAGYTVADYDDEEYQDLYDDTNELEEYEGCFDC